MGGCLATRQSRLRKGNWIGFAVLIRLRVMPCVCTGMVVAPMVSSPSSAFSAIRGVMTAERSALTPSHRVAVGGWGCASYCDDGGNDGLFTATHRNATQRNALR